MGETSDGSGWMEGQSVAEIVAEWSWRDRSSSGNRFTRGYIKKGEEDACNTAFAMYLDKQVANHRFVIIECLCKEKIKSLYILTH